MKLPWQIGKGIAMGCLAHVAGYLTIHAPDQSFGAWLLLFLWIMFGEWK